MSFPPPSRYQARCIWLGLTALALMLVGTALAAVVWSTAKLLELLSPVLWPLAIGGVIAYLLDPVVDWLSRRGVPRFRALLLVFFGVSLLLLGVAGSLVPRLVVESRMLADRVPEYAQKLILRVENFVANPPVSLRAILQSGPSEAPGANGAPVATPTPAEPSPTPATPGPATSGEPGPEGVPEGIAVLGPSLPGVDAQTIASLTQYATGALRSAGTWLFGQLMKVASWFGVFAGLALIPVYAFYFLLEKDGIRRAWTDYLPVSDSTFKEELVFVIESINNYLIVFFRSQVLVAICDGILYTIGFLAVGLNFAMLLGVMATFLTMIPFLGAIATCLTALILAAVQFGDWLHPLLILVVFGVVQAIEGLVISPKIMGDRVGLHPLTIIVAVVTGTTLLGGLLGGILAIPLTAALRVIMARYIWHGPGHTPRPLPPVG